MSLTRSFALSPLLLLAACTGTTPDSADDTAADTASAGGPVELFGSARSRAEDHVGRASNAVTPDGEADIAYGARVEGAADALYFLITDSAGNSVALNNYYRQADTDAGTEVTDFVGTTWTGAETWVLGVEEGGALLNAADGTVTLGEGTHDLTLWIAVPQDYDWSSDPAVLYALRPDGALDVSAVYDPV